MIDDSHIRLANTIFLIRTITQDSLVLSTNDYKCITYKNSNKIIYKNETVYALAKKYAE